MGQQRLRPFPTCARLVVEGSGFLYKQVRHMTGALLAVGAGRLGADAIAAALEAGEEWAGAWGRGSVLGLAAGANRCAGCGACSMRCWIHVAHDKQQRRSDELPSNRLLACCTPTVIAGKDLRSGAERHAHRDWMAAEAKGLCLHAVEYAPASQLPAAAPGPGGRNMLECDDD